MLQARYKSSFLRNTGQFFKDGTHGWGKVISITKSTSKGVPDVILVYWKGVDREVRVLKSNLDFKGQAPEGWESYDSSTNEGIYYA